MESLERLNVAFNELSGAIPEEFERRKHLRLTTGGNNFDNWKAQEGVTPTGGT